MAQQIPFVDLHSQYVSIKSEIDQAIAAVIEESAFVRGKHVDLFEQNFAEMHGIKHCISCANGTDSLYIAMHSLGVKPGDEVIAPAHSWISTTETITQAGAKVVFCDTHRDSYTIDPDDIKRKITSRTVGIIPVHLFGQPADMDLIMDIASQHSLWVIEDCAQSHLAKYKGRFVGTFGTAASFSFYPGKNLGAMGDAGALITNDSGLANKMAMFARHGGLKKGDHQIEGINSRLDGLQAAILNAKLPFLKQWTVKRQEAASRYIELLNSNKDITVPFVALERDHVWHLFVIKHEERDRLKSYLGIHGIDTVINYPIALPFLPAYKRYNHTSDDFPNAHFNQSRILSLPMYPEISQESIYHICDLINRFN